MIFERDLKGYVCPPNMLRGVRELMTPKSLLNKRNLPEARMITPEVVSSYDDLLNLRAEIKHLRLLPIKAPEDREAYHKLDQSVLLADLEFKMGSESLALMANAFPYFLPPDVLQLILWVRPGGNNRHRISQLISYGLHRAQVPLDQVIMFERPKLIRQPLIKGTFRPVRHIHVWMPKS